jgi:clan AA aspartic protease
LGTFSVNIEVGDLSGREYRKLTAMVDTGATYTVIPRDVLEHLDVRPVDVVPFELADDHVVEFEVGEVRLRLDKRERIVLVVFGPESGTPLLGATALELFNRAVDPVHQRLVPVTALLKTYLSRQ